MPSPALPSALRIAWRNLGRSRRRTALALATIGVAQLVLILYEGVLNGTTDATVRAVTGPLVGHVQVHAPGWREDHAMDRLLPGADGLVARLRADPAVARASARVYGPALAAVGEEGHGVLVLGVEPEAESVPGGLLGDVPPAERPGHKRVLVGKGLAETLGATPGVQLAIVGQAVDGAVASELYTVAGVLDTSMEELNRTGVVLSLPDARELFAMPGAAHELVIHARDPRQAEALAARLASLPELKDTEVLPWRQLVPELASIVELSQGAGLIMLVLVFLAAAAGVANTMLMATFERTHELGMLLALGARPGRLVRLIVMESLVLGLVGVLLGSVAGLALVLVTQRTGLDLGALSGGKAREVAYAGLRWSMDIYPRPDTRGVVRGVVAVVVTSLLASLWPAARVARLQPMEAMRA